ncbi:MAG: DNA replication/repair protein RecF [Gammaproteobacteria bacterium]
MVIELLQIKDLRNIESAKIKPSSYLNIITGKNASGKSSLLEAIHLLFLSRSFRSSRAEHVIKNGKESLQVVAKINLADSIKTLGIERDKRSTLIKYAGEKINSASELASIQPIVLLTPENHQLILGSPTKRRKLIDWLLFHVEQDYYQHWKIYYKTLKQRNAILRKRRSINELSSWDEKLIQTAEAIDQQRKKIIDQFDSSFQKELSKYCEYPVTLIYENGWGEGEFRTMLQSGREKDFAAGYTRKGPHRSDLLIKTNDQFAAQVLSRGQTKLLATALEITKILLLKQRVDKNVILLVDDLPAELDSERKECMIEMLSSVQTQQFITATEKNLLPKDLLEKAKLFHVEHGHFQEVL